jgi:hypothetical protein
MTEKITSVPLPPTSLMHKYAQKIDYLDCFRLKVYTPKEMTVDQVTARFFSSSLGWDEALLKLRNLLVKTFGLKGGEFIPQKPPASPHYVPGDKALMFTVIARDDEEIVTSESDKHLVFWTSVRWEKLPGETPCTGYFYSSTLVHYHNFGGRLYFWVVKPFHKLIIKSLMKKMANELQKELRK